MNEDMSVEGKIALGILRSLKTEYPELSLDKVNQYRAYLSSPYAVYLILSLSPEEAQLWKEL